MKYNPIQAWLINTSASNSSSNTTQYEYNIVFAQFIQFVEKTATQIIKEYENSTDRKFKRTYAQYIKAYINTLHQEGKAPNTIRTRIGIIRSYFKYHDLPLGYIPKTKPRITYHNRDITHEEIKLIINSSRRRERAFYAIMAQSGLRPDTICNLKYENIKEDYENNTIPCKIDIPQEITKGKYHPYHTFIGEEAIKYLQAYLNVRPKLKDETYLFLSDDNQNQVNPKTISRFFAKTVQKLHENGLINLKQIKENKPHDIRLYNLRKFFRKYANQAGFENVEYWMGHTGKIDEHYRPKDPEYYRKAYTEHAILYLKFETATPTETIKTQQRIEQENKDLKDQIEKLEAIIQKIYEKVFHEEIKYERQEKQVEEYEKYCEEHPEEVQEQAMKQREEYEKKYPIEQKRMKQFEQQIEEYEKYYEEHPEELEKEIKQSEEQWIRFDERRKMLRKLQNITEQTKTKNPNKQNDTA